MRRPVPPASTTSLAALWNAKIIGDMLARLWEGYDRLLTAGVPTSRHQDEDWLNQELVKRITLAISDRRVRDPFMVINQHMNIGSRNRKRRSPPTSDFAFLPTAKMDCAFDVEAKVIESKGRRMLGKYTAKFRSHFLKGRYSARCPAGVMIGYYSSLDSADVFRAIGSQLAPLTPEERFSNRNHRASRHYRRVRDKGLSTTFTCHHLLLAFGRQPEQRNLL